MVVEPGEVAARRRELHWQGRGGEDKEWKNKNTNTQTHNSLKILKIHKAIYACIKDFLAGGPKNLHTHFPEKEKRSKIRS